MPTKKKPKYDWQSGGTFTPYFYAGISSFHKSATKKQKGKYFKSALGNREATIDDLTDEGITSYNEFYNNKLQEIAVIFGLHEVSDKFKELLQGVIQNYLINKKHMTEIPRLSKVRASLEEVRNKTKSLIELLEKIDAIALDKMATIFVLNNLGSYDTIENKENDIHKIYYASEQALKELKEDKGGYPEKTYLKNLIFELNEMYEKITGKKATSPTRKKLYDLAGKTLTLIDTDASQSDESLRQYIKMLVPIK
jgi:hypothetical protein